MASASNRPRVPSVNGMWSETMSARLSSGRRSSREMPAAAHVPESAGISGSYPQTLSPRAGAGRDLAARKEHGPEEHQRRRDDVLGHGLSVCAHGRDHLDAAATAGFDVDVVEANA